jgi:hypothetical protein
MHWYHARARAIAREQLRAQHVRAWRALYGHEHVCARCARVYDCQRAPCPQARVLRACGHC